MFPREGCWFTDWVVRLAVLAALALCAVQPVAAATVIAPGSIDAVAAVEAHHADGTPCKGHAGTLGAPCCSTSGCQLMSGWLVVTSAPLPIAVPVALDYDLAVLPRFDGVIHMPTPPPPRRPV
jgi:hypothetical protein